MGWTGWYQSTVLMALQQRPHIYAGTANPNKVARRHAKNKVASRSRRINRSR